LHSGNAALPSEEGDEMAQQVYCPRCGTPMERRFVDDREREVCPACGFIFYRNPVPAVGVVVAMDGQLVLVRRRYEPRAGCWALPAGFMELGESAEEAAIRECHEETGLLVRVDHLLGVYSFGEGQDTGLLIIYSATATGGELVAADDATEVGVFQPDALPAPMAFRSHLQAIDRWRREARATAASQFILSPEPSVGVRYARQRDAGAALGLLLEGVAPGSDRYVAAEALLHDRLNDPNRPVLVAEQAGAICGVALLALHQAPRGWHATLDDLAVAPGLRRQGNGRVLVEAAARIARGRACAFLQVAFPAEDVGAREFLRACGFSSQMPALKLLESSIAWEEGAR
jgi:ADP-ribose pyrophosphatase YjhB (NUDIX family)/GNAT superfamily N-acetyltransferase